MSCQAGGLEWWWDLKSLVAVVWIGGGEIGGGGGLDWFRLVASGPLVLAEGKRDISSDHRSEPSAGSCVCVLVS